MVRVRLDIFFFPTLPCQYKLIIFRNKIDNILFYMFGKSIS